MRALLAALLLTTLVFAGCSDDPTEDDGGEAETGSSTATQSGASSGTSSASRSGSTSATGTGSNAANRAPTGSIAAALNGTNVTFSLTGTDADGDALTWTLSFGDGTTDESGTALPSNVTHTYAAGNHTAVYNLTDGEGTASYNVTINVTSAGSSGSKQAVAGSWPVGAPGCAAEYPMFPPEMVEASGSTFFAFAIAADTIGKPYAMTMTWESTPFALGGDIAFYDAEGAYVEGNLIAGGSPLSFTGVVPSGATHAVTTVCDGPGAEIVYVAG